MKLVGIFQAILPVLLVAPIVDAVVEETIEQHQVALEISPTLNQPIINRPVSYANYKVIEIIVKNEDEPLVYPPPSESSTDLAPSFDSSSPPFKAESSSAKVGSKGLPSVLFDMSPTDGFQIWEANSTHIKALVNPSIYLLLKNLTNLHIDLLHSNIQEVIDRETFDIMHSKALKANNNNLVRLFLD